MRIPFQLPEADGLQEAAGYLYLDGDYFVFEFHTLEWDLWHYVTGETEIVKVDRSMIADLEATPGWFKDRLRVTSNSVKLLKAIPGPHVSAIELRTRKRDRAHVKSFVERVRAWKAGEAG